MAPNSAPPIRNVVALAAAKTRSRNSRTSISGRSARQAWRTNSATSTMPTTIGPHTSGSLKPPCDSLSDSPNTTPASAGREQRQPEPVEPAGVGAARVGLQQPRGEHQREPIAIGTLT